MGSSEYHKFNIERTQEDLESHLLGAYRKEPDSSWMTSNSPPPKLTFAPFWVKKVIIYLFLFIYLHIYIYVYMYVYLYRGNTLTFELHDFFGENMFFKK